MKPAHPGELIADYLEYHGWKQKELARRTDCTPKHICELLSGRARVTVKMAFRLEPVLGRPAHFWLNLQQKWDLYHARLEAARS